MKWRLSWKIRKAYYNFVANILPNITLVKRTHIQTWTKYLPCQNSKGPDITFDRKLFFFQRFWGHPFKRKIISTSIIIFYRDFSCECKISNFYLNKSKYPYKNSKKPPNLFFFCEKLTMEIYNHMSLSGILYL